MALPLADEAEAYKRLKEAFVSDHYGGSIWEINAVAFVAPAAVLLWSVLQAKYKFFDPYTPLAAIADFLLHCCGILFATTIYSNDPLVLVALLCFPVLSIFIHSRSDPKKTPKKPTPEEIKKTAPEAPEKKFDDAEIELIDTLPVKPFVTHYRGAMLIVTCVCILAVDFQIFPRRFAKTESLGTSLMDLGVGSFVFSAGVVSVRQQLKEENGDIPRSNFISRFLTSIKHSLPLIALGLIRLYSVKKLNYAEHVTEYGVHWNFFFTLAAIPPFVAIFQSLFRLVPSYAIIGYAVSLVVEMCFSFTTLLHWLAFAPRDTFVNANKEGLISIPGYLAIFLAGQGIGMAILQRDQEADTVETENDVWLAQTLGGNDSSAKVREMRSTHRRFAWLNLAKYSVIWCVLYQFSTGYYGPRLTVSRRFANMAYFIWVAAFNTVLIWVFATIEMVFFPDLYKARHKKAEMERVRKATSRLLKAFNRNGLAIFLFANVLTGVVNMQMRTIEMGHVEAMGVLVGYLAVLSGVALVLDHFDISIKI